MTIVNTETALFVTVKKAIEACVAARHNMPNVILATPHRRYSRGNLIGYWVNLELNDRTYRELNETDAEGIFPCKV